MNIQVKAKVSPMDVLEELVQTRLGHALGRFGHRIERAAVTLEDMNPGGGADIECRIKLLLRPSGEVNVSAEAGSLTTAVSAAAVRAARCTESLVHRRPAQHSNSRGFDTRVLAFA